MRAPSFPMQIFYLDTLQFNLFLFVQCVPGAYLHLNVKKSFMQCKKHNVYYFNDEIKWHYAHWCICFASCHNFTLFWVLIVHHCGKTDLVDFSLHAECRLPFLSNPRSLALQRKKVTKPTKVTKNFNFHSILQYKNCFEYWTSPSTVSVVFTFVSWFWNYSIMFQFTFSAFLFRLEHIYTVEIRECFERNLGIFLMFTHK